MSICDVKCEIEHDDDKIDIDIWLRQVNDAGSVMCTMCQKSFSFSVNHKCFEFKPHTLSLIHI